MRPPIEIEAKFTVPDPAAFRRLAEVPEISGYALDAPEVARLGDTYLDTAGRTLLAARTCCRVRREGTRVLATVKSFGEVQGPVHRREELETPLPGDFPPPEWPEGPARDRVLALAAGQPLLPLVHLRQVRRTRRVRHAGLVVAELCLDDVVFSGPGGEEPVLFAEVELASGGTEDDLARVVAALRSDFGLVPEPRTKLERAVALLTPAAAPVPPAPSVDEDGHARVRRVVPAFRPPHDQPGLIPDDTMAEAARKTLAFHLDRMLRHEQGTRAGEDPEELHDMRVATRRMRAAFRVFREHLSGESVKPFEKALKAAGRHLGTVRDLDVFMEKTRVYIDALPADRRPDLDGLLACWAARRGEAREVLLAWLGSEGYRSFTERFASSLSHPEEWREHAAPDCVMPVRVRDVLPAVLYQRVAEVRAYDSLLGEGAPVERYHALRIASKWLRYTLEFFREVLGPATATLVDDMKALQDHLGNLQDTVVARAVARNYLAFGTWEWPKKPQPVEQIDGRDVAGVTSYLLARQSEAEALVRSFPPVWERIRSRDFAERIAAAVSAL